MSKFLNASVFITVIFVAVLMASTLAFGADSPLMGLVFTTLLLLLAGGAALVTKRNTMPMLFFFVIGLMIIGVGLDYGLGRLHLTIKEYMIIAAAVAVLYVGYIIGRNPKQLSLLWQLIIAALSIYAVWAFIDFVTNPAYIFGTERPYHQDRLSGSFLSANTAATFFGVTFLVCLASMMRVISKTDLSSPMLIIEHLFRHSFIGVIGVFFAGLCLVLTASRSGILFTGLASIVYVLWEMISRAAKSQTRQMLVVGLGIFAVGAVLAAMIWSMNGDIAGARLAETAEDSNMRYVMYSSYWQAHFAEPIYGRGFGSFANTNRIIMTEDNASILVTQGAAHNVILQWLLQMGWVGLISMLIVYISIMVTLFWGMAKKTHHKSILRSIICISMMVSLHSMIDYAVEIPAFLWWFTLFLGIGIGIAHAPVTKRRKSSLA